ncbi:MAG TPA: hypothetical protein VJR23_09865 [Candidatus Acidoferrales bacterium]|nr:hypothetical protein [Candidatus Acidoferrales bacterium]
MFLGHFGIALAARRAAPKASLGTLVLGAQLADLLWPIFLLLGWEQVRIDPGNTRVTPMDFVSYPWSHSLVMQIAWGALLAIVYFAIRRDARSALVAGACVPTHWVLDWITHRPDMPIVPGGARYGLGMWNSIPLTLAAEFALFGIGALIYLRATKSRDRTGAIALWALLLFLGIVYLASTFGSPPPNEHAVAYMTLAMWLLVPWAAWADHQRVPISN